MSITCYDSNNNPLNNFWQWDTNQSIKIGGLPSSPQPLFHFTNKKRDTAYVVSATGSYSNSKWTVKVPNAILQEPETIMLYVYQPNTSTSTSKRTVEAVYIPVYPRAEPEGYIFEENIEYISIMEVNNRLDNIIKEIETGGGGGSIDLADLRMEVEAARTGFDGVTYTSLKQAIVKNDEALNARIDELVGDEMEDARNGYEGTHYQSVGANIRGSDSKLQDQIDDINDEIEDARTVVVDSMVYDSVGDAIRACYTSLLASINLINDEIADARLGADGVTYQTLGAAIRVNDAALKSEINTIAAEVDEINSNLGTLTGDIVETLQDDLNTLRSDFDTEIAEVQGNIEELQAGLESTSASLESEIDDLEAALQSNADADEALAARVDALEEDLEDNAAADAELKGRVEDVEDRLDENDEEHETIQAALNDVSTVAANAANSAQTANLAALEADNKASSVASDVEGMKVVIDSKIDNARVSEDGQYLYLIATNEVGEEELVGPFGPFSGGGGGGGGESGNNAVLTATNASGWSYKTVAKDQSCVVTVNWSSIESEMETGPGIVSIAVGPNDKNMSIKYVSSHEQGNVSVDVGEYLTIGDNVIAITVSDIYDNSKTIKVRVSVVSISISSSFDQAYNASNPFVGIGTFPFTAKGSVQKTVHFKIDGEEIATSTLPSGDVTSNYSIPVQSHGSHFFEVYFTCVISGSTVESNHLYYDIMWTGGSSTPIISSSYHETTVDRFTNVVIKYFVYQSSSQQSNIQLKINGNVVNNLTVDRSEQTWSYRAETAGDIVMQIVCGQTVKTFNINVRTGDIDVDPITENLQLYLTANGRSNNENDPAVWTYEDIECEMTGFNFISDGWVNDEDNNTVLRLRNNARVSIPFYLFADDARSLGKTIEFEFATHDVMNYDATIISATTSTPDTRGIGIEITAQKATLQSEQTDISTQFKEDEHVRVSFVIEKRSENRLIYIYINGIMTGVVQYSTTDNFQWNTPANIEIGSNDCAVDIYAIRAYSNDLTRREIVTNFIADTQNVNEMLERFERNNILDASGKVSREKLPNYLPYMVIEGPKTPQYKGDKQNLSGYYVDPVDESKSFTFVNAQFNVQGTSSQYYPRKNYKVTFKNGLTLNDGTESATYALRDGAIPCDTFTFKADVASSEGCNNVELIRLYNDTCVYKTPPQKEDDRIRQGIDGFPIVMFWNNTDPDLQVSDESERITFLGKYNFNNDKGTPEVYGFEDGDESWEISNNTSNLVLFKSDDYTDWSNDFEARYPEDNEDITNLRALSTWIVGTDTEQATGENLSTPVVYTEKSSLMSRIVSLYKEMVVNSTSPSASAFLAAVEEGKEGWILTDDQKDEVDTFLSTYAALGASSTINVSDNSIKLRYDKDSVGYRLHKFKHELKDHMNVDDVIFYYLFTELFLMIDSRAKNAFPTIFDEDGKWIILPYDFDTAIGINNEGSLVFSYELEDIDHIGDSDVFNGQNSVLWVNLRKMFYDEMESMYQRMRASGWSYDIVENMFETHQAKWSETIFNEDAHFKYLLPLIDDSDSTYLPMLQGSKEEQRKWWLYNRFKYLDSKYNVLGDSGSTSGNNVIQLRGYAKDNISVTPYANIYAAVKYGSYVVSKRANRNETYELPCPLDNVNDTEILIHSASQLKDVGDLSGLKVGLADFSKATKLQGIKVGQANSSMEGLTIEKDPTYPFTLVDSSIHKYSASNLGVDNKTSKSTWFLRSMNGANVTCSYSYLTENNYDKLSISVDGTTRVSAVSGSGSSSMQIELHPGEAVKVVAWYTKDSSTSATGEKADIQFSSTAPDFEIYHNELPPVTDGYENVNLNHLVIGNLSLLKSIDARNCVNLSEAINLSGCPNLETAYFAGTSITGIDIANGAPLRVLELPSTITNLTLKNLSKLTTFVLPSYDNITTINVENTNIVDAMAIIKSNQNISRVRVIGVEWEESSAAALTATITRLMNLRGLDANGNNTDMAVVSGTVRAPSVTIETYNNILDNFPDLKVISGGKEMHTVTFVDEDGTVLYRIGVADGGTATDPVAIGRIPTPSKDRPNSETTGIGWGFNGWDHALTNVTESFTTTPVYADGYRVRFYNDDRTTVLYTTFVVSGKNASYGGNTPTKASTAQYSYTFDGWDSTLNNITAVKNIYATYASAVRTYAIRFYSDIPISENTLLQEKIVAYGELPAYTGSTPVKPGYTSAEFRFDGWDREIEICTGEANYCATYVDLRSVTLAYLKNTLKDFSSVSLTSVRDRACISMTSIVTFDAPNVRSIGEYAFSGCTGLQVFSFENTETIGTYAFQNCSQLTDIELPSIRTIGTYAFSGCTKIQTVNITSTDLTSIGNYAFTACSKLDTIIIRSNVVPTLGGSSALPPRIKDGFGAIYVPTELIDSYKNDTNWSRFANVIHPISEYPVASFETISDTWDQIVAACRNGTYATKYNVGDTKELSYNGNTFLMMIVAKDTDTKEGGGAAPLTWISIQTIGVNHSMNTTSTNADGWEVCGMRSWLRSTVINALPTALKNNIVPVRKTYYDMSSRSTKVCTDTLWIPSVGELSNTTSYENPATYYSALYTFKGGYASYNPSTYAEASYWTRTAASSSSSSSTSFVYKRSDYNSITGYTASASASYGVVIGFCT